MSKRSFFIILCGLILGVSSMTGSGSAKNQIILKHWYWVPAVDQPRYVEMIDTFNQTHPHIKVQWENVPQNQVRTKFITAYNVGAGPDTFGLTNNQIGEYTAMNMLQPLDSYLKKWPKRNEIYFNLWENATINQKTVAMPWKLLTTYLYYRTDWFNEAGLKPPTTMDELLEAAKKLTVDTDNDGRIDRWGFGLRGGHGSGLLYFVFMRAWGAKLYDAQGKAAFNTPLAIEATQWYLDLLRKWKAAPPSAIGDGFPEIVLAFKSGRTAMLVHHIGTYAEMTAALGNNVSAVTFPAGRDNNRFVASGLIMHGINRKSAKKDAAWEFISWMSEDRAVRFQAKALGSVPVLKNVANEPYFQENRFFKASIEGIPHAKPWPTNPGWGNLSDHLSTNLLQKGLLGQLTAEQIVEEINTALEDAK